MTDREYLIHIMDIVEKYGSDNEPGQLFIYGSIRDREIEDDEIREQDRRFIRHGRVFAEWYTDEYCEIEENGPWWDHIAKIVEGRYPLEKLPDHVRDLAEELYYG